MVRHRKRKHFPVVGQHGFSLIELLIYIAIFSIIITAIVGLAVTTSLQRIQNQVISEVNYQGEAIMSLMTQTIRGATSITAPSPGNNAGTLTLTMPTSSVNPTTFTTFNDGKTIHLQVNEGSPATSNYLSNSHTKVTSLSFANASLAGSKGSIMIKFVLSYNSTSSTYTYNYSKTFYGAADIR